MANPAYANPGAAEVVQILKDEKRVPFFIVADTHLTETGALADILLPMATYLESWNLESRPAMEFTPFVSIRQPLVAPGAIPFPRGRLPGLARRMGEDLRKPSPIPKRGVHRSGCGPHDGLARRAGINVSRKKGFGSDPATGPNTGRTRKRGFRPPREKTKSSPTPPDKGPSTPSHLCAHPGPRGGREKDLSLTVHPGQRHDPGLANSKWLAEIFHANFLWLNPRTAEARGIREGDPVKITSKAGTLTTKVRLSQGVHPRVATLAEGLGHSELGKIAKAKAAKTADLDSSLVWWEKEGNGVNPAGGHPPGTGSHRRRSGVE